jgi:hypothetical protein
MGERNFSLDGKNVLEAAIPGLGSVQSSSTFPVIQDDFTARSVKTLIAYLQE